jgi:hypothetical protein
MNRPVAAIAIAAPVEIFRISITCPLIISNAKSKVLINVIVHDNNTTTLPQRGKQKFRLIQD